MNALKKVLFASMFIVTSSLAFAQSNNINSAPDQTSPVPAQWHYSFDPQGNAVATYPGTVTFPGFPPGGAAVTAPPYNWVGDGQSAAATWGGGSTAVSGIVGKPGQLFAAPGVGVGGAPFQTTFQSTNALSASPTYSSGTWYASGEVCPVATHGAGVQPNDTFAVTGAGFSVPTNCIVISTGVYGATVASAGSGAAAPDGSTCIVSGTTGNINGVKFAALATITGGGISSIINTAYPGQYYGAGGNPTNINAEPVVSSSPGCSTLTGATLALTMGVNRAWITQPGNSNSQPAATQTPTNIIGTGTGVTFSLVYAQSGQTWWGTDNQNAIANFTATAAAGTYHIPAGTYLTSCPPANANKVAWPFTNDVSLYGDAGQSIIQLSPSCVQPTASELFLLNGKSGLRWKDLTLDFNNSTTTTSGFPYYNSMTRNTDAGILVEGDGQDAAFDDVNFINMRSGQIGLQVFNSVGHTYSHLTYQNSRCTENTMVGPINHCFYATHQIGGDLKDIYMLNVVSIGSNSEIQATDGLAQNNDVCCQGYGGAINIAASPTLPANNVNMIGNWLHDANNGVEDGDGDIPSGSESYDLGGLFQGNHVWNEPGPGLKLCAEHNQVKDNFFWDNGGAIGPNQVTGSVRWQLNAGIALVRQFGIATCDSNGALITGNHAWDTYTWALANGYSTAGLTATQYFGISENGLSAGDLAKIFADNDFGYNASGFSPTVGAAQIAFNGNGTGYGATASGTMTYAGGSCSPEPALNVRTNSTGAISVISSIANPGSCAALPSSTDTNWTPSGGLSAGTGASFALTTPINVTGVAYANGTEAIDAITASAQQSVIPYNWGEAQVSAGTTAYFYGSATQEASRTLFANNSYAGVFRRLKVSLVLPPVTSPAVFTFYTGTLPGNIAGGPLTCSIAVGQTSCSVDVPQSVVANSIFLIQAVNGSTSATGQISIAFEFWRAQ